MTITQALIMAAGEAKRMRPLTDHLPKPLLTIGDQSLLEHCILHLRAAGVTKIIINGHYKIECLKQALTMFRLTYPDCDFILSEETDLLETGGGTVKALPYLDREKPFYMVNGDAYWINPSQKQHSLDGLKQAWNALPNRSGAMIMLLQPLSSMPITRAVGDYDIMDDGRAVRSLAKSGTHMFTGIRLCDPTIMDGYAEERFSFLEVMDKVQQQGKLYGLSHTGQWFNINSPDEYHAVNQTLFGIAS